MLQAVDDRINWAAVAGALCLYDVVAAQLGWVSASRWLRRNPPIAALFVFAIANHLYPRTERCT